MFDWLFEGWLTIYVSLACVGVLLLFQWWQLRKRSWLYGVVGVAALAGVYFLLDRTVETDREQIERKVREMAEAVKRGDVDAIFRHLSESFRLNGADKGMFRNRVEGALAAKLVDEVEVWDVELPENRPDPDPPPGMKSLRIFFRAKPKGGRLVGHEELPYLVRARFVLDPDGQWRMQWFQISDPVGDHPLDIPYLGR
jgi:hypothetical protein